MRERQCLSLAASGRQADRPCARRLGKKTVELHLACARRKLAGRTTTQAVAKALLGALVENVTDYAELLADFFGPFHDLRDVDPAKPYLDRDPAIGYPAGQALARRVRAEAASNGIVYRSVRRAGGTCLAAFRPDLVQNLREGGIWRLRWQGTPEPSVTRPG
jgi:RES domain